MKGYGRSIMKHPRDIAASPLDSADAHKRSATRIKRVAGSLQAEIARADTLGLNRDEVTVLAKAVALLDALGKNYATAAAIRKREQTEFEKQHRRVSDEVRKQFASLATVGDQVCLVAAVMPYLITTGSATTWNLSDLAYYMDEAKGTLAYTLTKQLQGRSPKTVVQEAWEKFQQNRTAIGLRHGDIIAALGALSPSV